MPAPAPPLRSRWRVGLLAALTAVLAVLLPAAPASATMSSAAETRVGAFHPATTVVVGVHECISAGQRPVRGPSQLQVVSGSCVAAEAGARAPVNGETVATAFGRQMHATWDYGPGFRREFTLDSGRRVDGINFQTRQVMELKPNNARAIRGGERQLDDYLAELNEMYPGTPWTGKVVTYDR